MATIINAIRTVFSAQGAGDVEDATDRVGRAQNRLGQASASAGRSFAAQSSGLGGLVAAYAGAAATIFAITEAFNILNRAAQAETIVRGTNTLASELGQSGPRILKSVQEITQGQLTLAESAQNVNIALAAGFNTKQIESLTNIATKASRALGRDLTESIQRVTRGAAKLEPELLDELGIFTRIDPAVRAYANSLNVTEASLTSFERRQAFVNAVIEEGNKKFGAIDTAAPSAQKSLEQLRAQVTELGTEFLQFTNSILAPLVDFFRFNAGNALLLFGGILSLVLGKGISLFKDWASSSLTSLSIFANRLAQVAEIVRGNFQNIQAAATAAKDAITARGGLAGTAAGLQSTGLTSAQATQLAGTGNFTTQLRGAGSRQLAQDVAQARQRFLAGGATVGAQRQADITTFQRAIDNLTASMRTETLAFKDAERALAAYNAAAANASVSTRLLTTASNLAGLAARGAAAAFTILNRALGAIAFVVTAAQLAFLTLGIDVLGKFRERLNKTTQSAENAKAGINALNIVAAGSNAQLTSSLKAVGATDKDLENIPKRLEDIDDIVESAALSVARLKEQMSQPTVDRDNVELGAQVAEAAVAQINSVSAAEKLAVATKYLTDIQYDLATATGAARDDLLQQELLYKALIERYKVAADTLAPLIGAISRISGIDSTVIAEIAIGTGAVVQRSRDGVTILGKYISTLEGADAATSSYATSGFALQNVLNLANDEFERGSTDSERLSQKLAGAISSFNELKASGMATTAALTAVGQEIDNLSNKVRDLKSLEASLDGVRKAFGSSIQAVESAAFSGFIDASGKIAKNTDETARNQQQYLKDIIESTENAYVLSQTATTLNAEQQKQVELNITAKKALTGQLLQNVQAVQQLVIAESNRTAELEQQRAILRAQESLSLAQATASANATRRTIRQDAAQQGIDILRSELDIEKKSYELAIDAQKIADDILNVESQIAIVKKSAASSIAADRARLASARAELKLAQAERAITIAERDPGSSQQDIINARRDVILLQQQIAKEEYKNNIEIIKSQGGINKAQEELDKSKIDQQIAILNSQINFDATQYNRKLELFDKETKLAEDRIRGQVGAITDQRAILNSQKDLDLLKIEQDKANAEKESKLLISQLEGYKSFSDSTTALIGGLEAFAVTVGEILGFAGADTSKIEQVVKDLPKTIIQDIDSTIARVNKNLVEQNNLYAQQATAVENVFGTTKTSLDQQSTALTEQLAGYQTLRKSQKQNLIDELEGSKIVLREKIRLLEAEKDLIDAQSQASGVNITAQLAEAQAEYAQVTQQLDFVLQDLSFETNIFKQALLGVKSAFRDTLTNELVNLNNSLYDTSEETKSFGERLRDSIGNVLRSVQEQFFRTAIAEPVSNFITDKIFGLFGLESNRGIEAARVDPDGALRVRLADGNILGDSVSNLFEGAGGKEGGFFSNLFSGISDFFSGLFGKNGIVANLFTGIFGSGGLFSSIFTGFGSIFGGLFGGIGSIFGSIFKGVFGLFGMAQGGMVQMASGGQLRDRVPTLLEPGEFVIRKPMARQIGVPALQQMNATGQTPMSAPVINFKNEGTAKSIQTEEPRFDGEKYVIDIITRDLQNNGPIRRTLRGGDV